jgi:5'-3' exonuclease
MENEHDFIKQEYKRRDRREKQKMPNITPNDKMDYFNNIPTYERAVEKFINPFKENWQYRYYKTLFDVEMTEDRKKQLCMNYLQGLEWTMKYYTSGCAEYIIFHILIQN